MEITWFNNKYLEYMLAKDWIDEEAKFNRDQSYGFINYVVYNYAVLMSDLGMLDEVNGFIFARRPPIDCEHAIPNAIILMREGIC